jgi:hypothetical protein
LSGTLVLFVFWLFQKAVGPFSGPPCFFGFGGFYVVKTKKKQKNKNKKKTKIWPGGHFVWNFVFVCFFGFSRRFLVHVLVLFGFFFVFSRRFLTVALASARQRLLQSRSTTPADKFIYPRG